MSSERPTMADVARRAGVSRALVSIVMREAPGAGPATRERVKAAAREIGYLPDEAARRLSRGRAGGSGLVGVTFWVDQVFHGDMLEELYAHCTGRDLTLSGVTAGRAEDLAIDALLRERCEAVILLGPTSSAQELTRLAARVPVVTVLRSTRAAHVDAVVTDEAAGMAAAVTHLAELGHRRIAHVGGAAMPGSAARRRGYHEAMDALGLPAMTPIEAGGTEEEGVVAAEALLSMETMPSAVTVFNDRCALGLINALRHHGLQVPADVSVVGFDDIRAAGYAHVGLTTVRQDAARLSCLAIERATSRIERPEQPARRDVVPPELVVRATTSAIGR